MRTGGFSADELRRAGAAEVSESLEDLLADLDNTPLSRPHGHRQRSCDVLSYSDEPVCDDRPRA